MQPTPIDIILIALMLVSATMAIGTFLWVALNPANKKDHEDPIFVICGCVVVFVFIFMSAMKRPYFNAEIGKNAPASQPATQPNTDAVEAEKD